MRRLRTTGVVNSFPVVLLAAVLLVIVLVLGVGQLFITDQTAVQAANNRVTTAVQKGDVTSVITATGVVEPYRNVGLAFQLSGLVSDVKVSAGAVVQQGDILATLDNRSLQNNLAQAQAQLQAAQSKLQALKDGSLAAQSLAAAQAAVKADQDRLDIAKNGNATPDQIQAAQNRVQEAQAKLAALQAGPDPNQVAAAQAALKQAQAQLAQLQAGPDAQALKQAQANLDAANASFDRTKSGLNNAVSQAAQDVIKAKNALDSAQTTCNQLTGSTCNASVGLTPMPSDVNSPPAIGTTSGTTPITIVINTATTTTSPIITNTTTSPIVTNTIASTPSPTPSFITITTTPGKIVTATVTPSFTVSNTATPTSTVTTTTTTLTPTPTTTAVPTVTPTSQITFGGKIAVLDAGNNPTIIAVTATPSPTATPAPPTATPAPTPTATPDAAILANAQRQLDNAAISYNQAIAAYNDAVAQQTAGLKQAQAQVDAAQAQFDQVKAGPDANQVSASQDAVDQAQALVNSLQQPPNQSDVNAAQDEINAAQSELAALQKGGTDKDIQLAQDELNKDQTILNQLQQGPTNYDLTQAETSVQEAQASVNQAQYQVDNTVLRAPFNGVISSLDTAPQQSVRAQESVMTISDFSNLKIDAQVSQQQVIRLNTTQSALVQFSSLPQAKTLVGQVSYVAPSASTQADGSSSYKITVLLTNTPNVNPISFGVRPGMTSQVEVVLTYVPNVLWIPANTIRSFQGGWVVDSVLPNGNLVTVPIKLGLVGSDGRVEVKPPTLLHAGDTLVVYPPAPTSTQPTAVPTLDVNVLNNLPTNGAATPTARADQNQTTAVENSGVPTAAIFGTPAPVIATVTPVIIRDTVGNNVISTPSSNVINTVGITNTVAAASPVINVPSAGSVRTSPAPGAFAIDPTTGLPIINAVTTTKAKANPTATPAPVSNGFPVVTSGPAPTKP